MNCDKSLYTRDAIATFKKKKKKPVTSSESDETNASSHSSHSSLSSVGEMKGSSMVIEAHPFHQQGEYRPLLQ